MIFKYQVVVDVEMNTQGAKGGANDGASYLRQVEQQAIESSKRMQKEDIELNRLRRQQAKETQDYISQISQKGYQDKVSDYHRQKKDFENLQVEQRRIAQKAIDDDIALRKYHTSQVDNLNKQIAKNDPFQNLGNRQASASQAGLLLQHQEYQKALQSEQKLLSQIAALDPFQKNQNVSAAGAGRYAGTVQDSDLAKLIAKNDPFQNLGNRQQSFTQAGAGLRSGERDAFNASILKNDPFQNAKNLNFEQTRQELARLDKSVETSSKGLGMWGQAFKGAFIGAVAGLTFSFIIGGITSLISKTVELGAEGVKLAANFETTTNAMTLFEGSTARARIQLADLDDMALHTPGLTLDDAETGVTRLRALNFEMDTAKNLAKGLATQKLISGVTDEGAVQRVIVNLQQLRAGSPQIQRDIQQMVLSLPSLSVQINKSFGSLAKFKQAIREDSEGALNKFAKGLADAKAPAVGLNVATENLLDTITLAERAFGEPILEPLTESVVGLTELVKQNESVWKSWGQTIGDIISGFNGSDSLPTSFPTSIIGAVRGALSNLTGGTSEIPLQGGEALIEYYRRIGEARRKENPYDRQLRELGLDKDFLNRPISSRRLTDSTNIGGGEAIPDSFESQLTRAIQKRSANDNQFDEAARLDKIEREKEKARQNELTRIDSQYLQIKNIRENAFNLEVAQNKNNAQKIFEITDKNYSGQIKDASAFYDKKIELADGDALEIYKLTVENNNTIKDLEGKQALERINFEREQFEKRRQKLIEYKELAIREVQATYADRISVIQQGIDAERIAVGQGYTDIADLVSRESNIESKLLQDKYDLRLQDESLNAQQRLNIEKEMFLELEDLTKSTYDRLIDLNNKRFDRQAELVRRNAEQAQNLFSLIDKGLASVQKAFEFGAGFMGGINGGDFVAGFGETGKQILDANTAYEKQTLIFKERQDVERVGLQNQIALNNQLLTIERERAEEVDRITYSNLLTRRENALLMAKRARDDGRQEDVDTYTGEATRLQAQALNVQDRLSKKASTSSAVVNLENSNQVLSVQEKQLKTTQAIDKAEFERARNLGVIYANVEAILNGQKDSLYIEEKQLNVARERENLADSIKRLELDLKEGDKNADLRLRAELLQHIVDLRNEEFDAVVRLGKAQIDSRQMLVYSKTRADADLADFLTSTNVTDVVSDARINALTAAYDGLGTVIGKVTDKFGIFGDVIKELLVNLVKLALNNVFMKMFFPNGQSSSGSNGGSQGGLSIPSLAGILSGRGGGQAGSGGTPLFNPNAGSGIGGGFGGFGGGDNGFGGLLSGSTRAHEALHTSGGGGLGITLKGLSGLLPMIGLGAGGRLGGSSATGGILGALGGGLGGLLASSLISGGVLFGTAATATSAAVPATGLLGIGALSGAATLGIGAAIVGALAVGSFLLGRNAARRRDEKTRNQAMVDAFKQIDDLIDKVKHDKIDGASALSSADQIRASYMEMANGLKDGKTRRIAIADVSRLDAKISILKQEISNQESRQSRLAMSVPTFADGGSMSKFAGSNYVNNPLGYQNRPESFGYFPSAGTMARFNERGSEYIFDAETTRNIGSHTLDMMRATKGESFNAMRRQMVMPSRADGGGFNAPQTQGTQTQAVAQGQPKIEVTIENHLSVEEFVRIAKAVVTQANGSTEQLNDIITTLKKQGGSDILKSLQTLLDKVKNG